MGLPKVQPDDEWYGSESELEEDEQYDAWRRLDELIEMQDWGGVATHKALMEEKSKQQHLTDREQQFLSHLKPSFRSAA